MTKDMGSDILFHDGSFCYLSRVALQIIVELLSCDASCLFEVDCSLLGSTGSSSIT
jgi:hypothetical protein